MAKQPVMLPKDKIYFDRLVQRLQKPEINRNILVQKRVARVLDILSFKRKERVEQIVNEALLKYIEGLKDTPLLEYLDDPSWTVELVPAFQFKKNNQMHVSNDTHIKVKSTGEES